MIAFTYLQAGELADGQISKWPNCQMKSGIRVGVLGWLQVVDANRVKIAATLKRLK